MFKKLDPFKVLMDIPDKGFNMWKKVQKKKQIILPKRLLKFSTLWEENFKKPSRVLKNQILKGFLKNKQRFPDIYDDVWFYNMYKVCCASVRDQNWMHFAHRP